MTRHRPTLRDVARWLAPSPERFVAAAAVYEPGLLLQLEVNDEQRVASTPARPR
jgi:hypothetical protein